jgi:putative membrane protein
MIRLLIRLVIMLLANAIGLIIAAAILPDMTISGAAFIIAVLIFTAIEVLAEPLLGNIAQRSVPALRGGVALIATFIGLVITAAVSSGLSITGVSTWLLATLIVWLAALIAALILPIFMVKKAVNERRD